MLRFTALAAATPIVVQAWRPTPAFAQVPSRAVPMHLELVTVTDTSAVLTWFTGDPTKPDEFGRPEPLPANTILELGDSPAALTRVVDRNDATPYHYVEVEGLEPGRPYWYRAISNGVAASPSVFFPEPAATGTFTTLSPPTGRLLFTMCWANDTHIGEMTSGLAYSDGRLPGGGFPPGFAADPQNPYWRFMAEAAIDESRAHGAEVMLFNGDLTSEAEPTEIAEAKRIFDRFGAYRSEYWVTRGNHDRAHSGDKWKACAPAGVPEYNDCLRDAFFPGGPTWFSFDHAGVHMVGLDTNNLTTGQGAMAPEQFDWLEADLAAHDGVPTFVFGHHPVSEESAVTAVPPVVFTLNPQDAERLESQVAAHSVVGVYSAHTHRNWRTKSPRTGDVPYIEVAAAKEYPGGYALVKVYEGGYMLNFHKTRSDPARAWSERSRGEYLGLYPYYTLGRFTDRNFVVAADFSDAARRQAAPPREQPPPSGEGGDGGGGEHPPTGSGATAVAGAALAAAAVGAARGARRIAKSPAGQ